MTNTTAPASGPDAARRGMLVVGAFVMVLSVAAFFRVPVLPAIGADLAMSASQLGMITTAFALGRLATDLPAGRLADRLAPLHSLALAGLMLGAGSGVFALAPTGAWVIGAAVLLGVASAVANTVGMTYFSQAAPTARRGMSMAWFSAALLGGQSLGPMVGGLIAELTGWRGAVGVAAGLGSLVLFVALAGARAGLAPRQRADAGGPADPGTGPPPAVPARQAWLLYAVAFVSFFMLGAMPQTIVAIIGGDRLALGAGAIGLALGLGGVCRFVGALAGGRLADRVSRKGSLVPGLLLGAAGVALLGPDLGMAGWLAAIVLLSVGSYSISTGATMLADHAGGRAVGRRLGKYRFVGDLGLIAGPALSTLLYEHVGTAAAVLLVAGLMSLVALLCAVLLTETRWLAATPSSPTVKEPT